LTCDDFLTDRRHLNAHQDQLDRTRKLIATAEADGNFRMAEMNRQVETNLTHIIDTISSRQVADEAMPPADNSRHLVQAAQQRSLDTRQVPLPRSRPSPAAVDP
jgi:hypothetical protein